MNDASAKSIQPIESNDERMTRAIQRIFKVSDRAFELINDIRGEDVPKPGGDTKSPTYSVREIMDAGPGYINEACDRLDDAITQLREALYH